MYRVQGAGASPRSARLALVNVQVRVLFAKRLYLRKVVDVYVRIVGIVLGVILVIAFGRIKRAERRDLVTSWVPL